MSPAQTHENIVIVEARGDSRSKAGESKSACRFTRYSPVERTEREKEEVEEKVAACHISRVHAASERG